MKSYKDGGTSKIMVFRLHKEKLKRTSMEKVKENIYWLLKKEGKPKTIHNEFLL
jgi:hypothetical protein